jgi:hypothetical protein
VVEHMPNKCKILSLNSSIMKKRRKKSLKILNYNSIFQEVCNRSPQEINQILMIENEKTNYRLGKKYLQKRNLIKHKKVS